jgi:hypothetical protein
MKWIEAGVLITILGILAGDAIADLIKQKETKDRAKRRAAAAHRRTYSGGYSSRTITQKRPSSRQKVAKQNRRPAGRGRSIR